MQALKKKIAADLKAMFVECEHGSVEPHELEEQINEFMVDCRDDLAAGSLTDREMSSIERMIARANRPTGELERLRAELKQAMKDAGSYTDPHALESLGFRLISGKTHWKLARATSTHR